MAQPDRNKNTYVDASKGLLGVFIPPFFGGSAALALLLGKLFLSLILVILGFGIFLRLKRGRVYESDARDA